jgi:SAM-dependent methyltransferase
MKPSLLLADILAHPLTKGLSLDDPRTTELRTTIIRNKGFLKQIYESWYRLLTSQIPAGEGSVLEVGSGGGFLKELHRDALASEVFFTPHVDIVLDAMALPFHAEALKAILMVDVLHHIPEPALFFHQAAKCVRSGGRCLMIEPWNTPWGAWVFQHLHHEPFNPGGGWTIPPTGPLSGANGALPWILFERDRALFGEKFPQWRVASIQPMMPLAYLLSGGVSMRSLMPSWSYQWVRSMEKLIPGLDGKCGMFAFIVLDRL